MSSQSSPLGAAIRPADLQETAQALCELRHDCTPVRAVGGATKLDWAPTAPSPPSSGIGEPGASSSSCAPALAALETGAMSAVLAHDHGDFTAVLQAGVPLATAQELFAEAGQRLALDPPLGSAASATIGGVLATSDSGPLRHRYGSARDLVIGTTVVLADGTIARSGGKVIKNVAGYDLGKLFVGSHGTLGLIAEVCVRLHPATSATVTLVGASDEPRQLAEAALALSRLPLEAECLDVSWRQGTGELLVRFAGSSALMRARGAAQLLRLEAVTVEEDDEERWRAQRDLQRLPGGAVIKVAGLPSELPLVLAAAERAGATLASRAALGISWLALPAGANLPQRVATVQRELASCSCALLDGAEIVRQGVPRGAESHRGGDGAAALMARIKARFDPDAAFRPGVVIGTS
jgi:glycolate oxidase FAD binding subunit